MTTPSSSDPDLPVPGLTLLPDAIRVRDVLARAADKPFAGEGVYFFEECSANDADTGEPSEASGLACSWQIRRDTVGLQVTGQIEDELMLSCDWCHQPFEYTLAVDIEEQFVLNNLVEEPRGGEKELQADDFYEVIDENGDLDLKDLAHQYLIMEMSTKRSCGNPPCPLNE